MSSPIELSQFRRAEYSPEPSYSDSPSAESQFDHQNSRYSVCPGEPEQYLLSAQTWTTSGTGLTDFTLAGDSLDAHKAAEAGITQAPASNIEVFHAKWYRGWTYHFVMVGVYLLAWAIAVGHILFFHFLDGKSADGTIKNASGQICIDSYCESIPHTSQQWVTTGSVFFTNAFQYCFSYSIVSLAFTQYMWRRLRTRTMKVGTIEHLFNVRSNPFTLFRKTVWTAAWVLVVCAIVGYLIPFATSFPPGALTIKSITPNVPGLAMVPTYNVTDVGNGTVGGLTAASFATIVGSRNEESTNESAGDWDLTVAANFYTINPDLERLAATTNFAGKPQPISSPCGPNCTYTYEFQGPSFNCIETSTNRTLPNFLALQNESLHTASWYYNHSSFAQNDAVNSTQPILLDMTLVNLAQVPYNITEISAVGSKEADIPVLVVETNLQCVPWRSTYSIQNTYVNSIQTLNYTVTPIELIPHLDDDPITITGVSGGNSHSADDLGGIAFTDELVTWWENVQMIGIINGLVTTLNGTLTSFVDNTPNTTVGGDVFVYWSSIFLESTGSGGPYLRYSRFASGFQQYHVNQDTIDPPISMAVNETLLNRVLGDYVVSIIPTFGQWNEAVNVTRFDSQNVFDFSSPLSAFVPYLLPLLLALPFLILGLYSLHENGMPASDGGVVQLLTTTSGNGKLRHAAAKSCLGGDGNKELMEMEIRYGELIHHRVHHNGEHIRRAGFGEAHEVMPITKGQKYGVVGAV